MNSLDTQPMLKSNCDPGVVMPSKWLYMIYWEFAISWCIRLTQVDIVRIGHAHSGVLPFYTQNLIPAVPLVEIIIIKKKFFFFFFTFAYRL